MHGSRRKFWIGLLLLTALLRAPALYTEVLDTDEAGHAVHSFVWLDGGTPYVDFIDNKQPLLYVTYAAVFALFGRNLIVLHLLTIPWLLLTAWLVSDLTRRLWRSRRAGRAAALLFTLFSSAYLEKDMLASNTEVFMNLPLIAAFWVVLRPGRLTLGRSALGGLLGGLAVLYNLKAGVGLPVLGLVPLLRYRGRGLGHTALMALASIAPWAPVALYQWSLGALDDLIFWNFLLNTKYAAAGVPLWLVDYKRGIPYGFPRLLLFVFFSLVGWIAAGAAVREVVARWRASRTQPAPAELSALEASPTLGWIALWLAFSFPAVCMGGRFYGHYFVQFLPPLAILGAGPLARLLGEWWPLRGDPDAAPVAAPLAPHRLGLKIAAVVWLLLPIVAITVVGHVRIARGDLDGLKPEVDHVSEYVRANTCPDDRIFVWGYWSQIYYFSGRAPASRFVYPQTLAGYVPGNPLSLDPDADTSDYIVPEHWDDFFDDMAAHPPELLLDVAPAAIHFWEKYPMEKYPRLEAFVRKHYRKEAVVDGVVMYRRVRGAGRRECPHG